CSCINRNLRATPNDANGPSTSAAGSAPEFTTTALTSPPPASDAASVSASLDVTVRPSGPASTITRNISQHLQFFELVHNGRCRIGSVAQNDGVGAQVFGHRQLA